MVLQSILHMAQIRIMIRGRRRSLENQAPVVYGVYPEALRSLSKPPIATQLDEAVVEETIQAGCLYQVACFECSLCRLDGGRQLIQIGLCRMIAREAHREAFEHCSSRVCIEYFARGNRLDPHTAGGKSREPPLFAKAFCCFPNPRPT